MITSTNMLARVTNAAMKDAGEQLKSTSRELTSGKRNVSDDIAQFVIGSRLESSATVLSRVARGIKYGSSIINVATSALNHVHSTLLDMRSTIAQAGTATGDALTQLNTLYQKKADDIRRILTSTDFDQRKVFEDLVTAADVASEGIASTAAELTIRLGDELTNNTQLAIPKLSAGDGTAADVAVSGRFEPLFPNTQDVAGAAIGNNLVIDAGDPDNPAGIDTATSARILLDNLDSKEGVHAMVVDAAKNTAINLIGGDPLIPDDPNASDNQAGYTYVLNQARAAAAAVAANYNKAEGDVLTPTTRATADALMNAAISTVTNQIASLGADGQVLENAHDSVMGLSNEKAEAAGNYRNAHYEDAISIFKDTSTRLRATIELYREGNELAQSVLKLLQ